MNPTTEHTEHPETATATKQPGGHPILIALAVLAVVAASVAFLLLRAPLLRMASDLMPDWKTGPGTPGDWALLVPGGVVVGIAASIVVLLAVASLLKTGAFALGLAIFFLVAAPCFFFYASASVGMATLDRYGLAISAASTQSPAAPESHAESAEPEPHAESAESSPPSSDSCWPSSFCATDATAPLRAGAAALAAGDKNSDTK